MPLAGTHPGAGAHKGAHPVRAEKLVVPQIGDNRVRFELDALLQEELDEVRATFPHTARDAAAQII